MTVAVGPVSGALERELSTQVTRHDIVVWLDGDGAYRGFVDALSAESTEPGYRVVAYRGSFLELMLALEGAAAGVDRPRVVVHLPGFNEDTVKETPLLELYKAGVRFRKALPTLVEEAAAGRVEPERIRAFLQQDDLTLEHADTWLKTELESGDESLRKQLDALSLPALIDDLIGRGYIASQMSTPEGREVILAKLRAWTGLPTSWTPLLGLDRAVTPTDIASSVTGWALVAEFTHDLSRAPVQEDLEPAEKLPRAVVDACRTLCGHLRERHPVFYERTADAWESLLAEERRVAKAADLGDIDTFRFEEEKVLDAALGHVEQGEWRAASELAERRLRSDGRVTSFWVQRDINRRSIWQLVQAAARLGLAIEAAGDALGANTHSAAVETYAARGAPVDRTHRHLEQLRHKLLFPRLARFEVLKTCLDRMRVRWQTWADGWAKDFSDLCRKEGFLPDPNLRQRALLEDVVLPLVDERETTAYILVDALRYEMAAELFASLDGAPGAQVRLEPRLAELPTVTEVGMNVLALGGGSESTLHPVLSNPDGGRIEGFRKGEYRVQDPETRRRSIHDQVGGSRCPWLALDVVLAEDSAALKRRIGGARLFVVHSVEIDKAGESGAGLSAFESSLRQLRAAWHLLRDAGVRRFVITSDHGFLLLEGKARLQPHGRKSDPQRRHVFSSVAADHAGEARVSLRELQYADVEAHLHLPETTAVFDRGKRPTSFVHGGNSLQERVIPVLTVLHRTAVGASAIRYALRVGQGRGLAGLHSVEVELQVAKQSTAELAFSATPDVELALQAVDAENVEVELVDVRGKAKVGASSFSIGVGTLVEVFFRLRGDGEERVPVEVFHPTRAVDVKPASTNVRFDVERSGPVVPAPDKPKPERSTTWLDSLPEGGVRRVFAHLAAHGTATEPELIQLLGNARKARRFALEFEGYAQIAPFTVRIESSAGVKRYIREGTTSS